MSCVRAKSPRLLAQRGPKAEFRDPKGGFRDPKTRFRDPKAGFRDLKAELEAEEGC